MPDLTPYARLLVFGGSFDPPHLAHVELPPMVAKRLDADAILYVPAARPPHKLDVVQTDARHRLAMLRLALRGRDDALVITDELDRGLDEPSYTVDTLEALRRRIEPTAELRLLIGADQLRIFDTWRDARRVEELAEPAVMVRPPGTAASLLAALPDDATRERWSPRLIELPPLNISSTHIREGVRRGEPIAHLVPAAVEAYIREHGLYHHHHHR